MHTVCICNNCHSLLNDDNPQTGALQTKYSFEDMKGMNCPKCKTDDFLSDLANTMNNKKLMRLISVREYLIKTPPNGMKADVHKQLAAGHKAQVLKFKSRLNRL